MASSINHSADETWQAQLNRVFALGQGSPEKQLMTLRAVTATTGVVGEAQLLQLKLWGSLAFGHTKWTAAVDVPGRTIYYTLVKGKHPANLVKFIAALDRSVHWLLGDNWGLHIKEGSKKLYEGQRQVSNVNSERKKRVEDTNFGRDGSE